MKLIHIVFYITTICYTEAIFPGKKSMRSSDNQAQRTVDGQAMASFANLLKTIVRVNEERVDAIKKIANLQDYMLTKNRLHIDDYYDSLETSDSTGNDTPKIRRMDSEVPLNERCAALYKESKGQPSADLIELCSLEAFHLCSLTCVQKFEETCYSIRYCTVEIIDKVAKECILNCKELFGRKDK